MTIKPIRNDDDLRAILNFIASTGSAGPKS